MNWLEAPTFQALANLCPAKDNCNVVLGWMSIDKLAELTSNPDFIKEMVNEMDASPQHVITRA